MPILTQCTHCQERYRVSSTALGKQAKCAKCGQRFSVAEMKSSSVSGAVTLAQASAAAPAKPVKEHAKSAPAPSSPVRASPAPSSTSSKPARAAAKPRGRLTQKELFAAFREPFPRSRPRISYRVGILLISLTMVVLPLVYLAFIALVGYGVYYHAVNHTWLLEMGRGRSRALVALVYAAPLIAGPIAVFFMFKPLLARPSRLERYRSLRRESEPLLFAFIDRICDEVGAPRPKRIDVNCTINAGAGFRRGILSMFGRDFVLVIGLALAAGLTMREFAGVLAHELGHFSQGLGMRLSYLVESIVDWFIRVVYQRDQWDDWLDETAQELDVRVGWIFLVAKMFVLIGRGILWVLFHIGLTISGIMLRQMEFDADRYQCRFAGSRAFASTMRKLHVLNAASDVAHLQLSASLDLRKLVDNYPGLIAYHAGKMAPEALPHIDKMIRESNTGWFDSHPCHKDRIAAAEKLASPGIFHCVRPAADLFTDFNAQAAAATWDLYLGYFGPKVPRTALQPLPEFLAAMDSCKQSR